MLLPNQRRIYTTDFPEEYQELINKLSESLNINLEVLYRALNKNVSLNENVSCTVKDISLTVDSSGTPVNPIAVPLDNSLPVIGVTVLNVENLTNSSSYPNSQPFVAWALNNQGRLIIRHISSLTAGNNYRLKIVIWN